MRLNTLFQVGLIALTVVLLLATPAEANAGGAVLLFVAPVLAVVVLVPIVLIETYFLTLLAGVSAGSALWVVSVANVASTLFGIPITLMLMPRSDYNDREEPEPWIVPAYFLLFVALFWAASWVIEYQVSAWMLPGVEPQYVNTGVLYGNLATYGIVAGFLLGWLLWEALVAVWAALSSFWTVQEAQVPQPAMLETQGSEPEGLPGDNGGQILPVEIEALVALGFIQLPLNGNGAGGSLPAEDYEERLESHPFHPVQEERE